ncbi:phage tail length tape measure family protein [Sphingomonas kyeonggiensis]|uniref:Bacteriophage tail tape measure N-terminal domain-containing protein n=1 Tax=Sphingomonas kyeonggiensis TaxID=1268553 RepID=A0A7W6JUH2_9SPHN|nr:phage tail length tape measure family protein [Sphingomonas kyeonggiensis]MBB4099783.1 hypothetical protein [Sphingomonas kyeonggiensis]
MDLAALNLSIDSSDVVKATENLDKFSAAAAKAGASTKQGSIARLAQDYTRAAEKIGQYSNAAMRAAAANDNVAAASKAAAAANDQVAATTARATSAANQAAAATERHASWLDRLIAKLRGIRPAADSAAAGIRSTVVAANDSAGALKANVGNIASQFQDVIVTAGMGMNPLMIALQQGTQLASVFAQAGGNAFKTLGGAILSVISPTSLLTIGLVALTAAGLQMVNWTKLAQFGLNGLANALQAAAPYAAGLGAVLTLAFAPQILRAIVTVAVAIGTTLYAAIVKATAAMVAFALANPFTAVVLAVAAVTAAVVLAGKAFGKDFVTPIRDGINFIVGGFVGAFQAIQKTWKLLPAAIGDAVIQAANTVIRTVDDMVNKAVDRLNGLIGGLPFGIGGKLQIGFRANSGQLNNPYGGSLTNVGGIAKDSITAAQKIDYVGKAIAGVNSLAASGAAQLREWAKALSAGGDKSKTGGAGADAAKISEEARALQERNRATEQYIANLTEEVAKIGLSDQALRQYEVTQALARATTDAQREAITKLSEAREKALKTLRQQQEVEAAQKSLDDARRNMASGIDVELRVMGLVGAEREREILRIQRQIAMSDLLAKIKKAEADGNIALADTYRQLAEVTDQEFSKRVRAVDGAEAIDRQRKAIESAREVTKGFFTDWFNGVREGENVFKSFERAVTNALNRIIDKLIEAAIEQMFFNSIAGLFGGGGAASGLGALGSTLGKLFADGGAFGTAQRYAHGGAFDHAQRFANGGTFTNRVITEPTLFRFAKGAKLGEMGEAGPEAVMPLSRDGNGRLGIAAHGGGGKPAIRMGDIHIHNSLAGAIGPEGLAVALRQSGEHTVAQIRRDLESMLHELDQNGVLR